MTFISKRLTLRLAILVIAVGLTASCVPLPPAVPVSGQAAATLTQGVTALPQPAASPTETLEPTVEVTATPTISFTETPKPTSTASPLPTARPTNTPRPTSTVATTPTKAPTPTATVDQHRVVITEDAITQAVAQGAGAQQGVNVQNLKVRFADGKIHITADKIGYGLIQMQNLDLVGRLVATNGVLSLQAESVSPRGLAANFIPTMANQALAQYASQWYVEDVQTLDGRVELRVR
jgi:hypothetical protein